MTQNNKVPTLFEYVTALTTRRLDRETCNFIKVKDPRFYDILVGVLDHLPPVDEYSPFRIRDYFDYSWGNFSSPEPFMVAQRAFFMEGAVVGTVTIYTDSCPVAYQKPITDPEHRLKVVSSDVELDDVLTTFMFGDDIKKYLVPDNTEKDPLIIISTEYRSWSVSFMTAKKRLEGGDSELVKITVKLEFNSPTWGNAPTPFLTINDFMAKSGGDQMSGHIVSGPSIQGPASVMGPGYIHKDS